MKDVENKFIKFLEDRGVLGEYKAKLKYTRGFDDLKAWLKSVNSRDFFFFAFPWGCVSGEEKWIAIHYKWLNFIEKDGAE